MDEHIFGLTDVGRRRDNNEDAFIAQPIAPNALLACVIDGVGGYEGGEVAAALAKEAIIEELTQPYTNEEKILRQAFVSANRRIFEAKQTAGRNPQMACVVTAALVLPESNQFFYAHVGDTRLYLLRDGSLVKVTKDQSFVGFLEDSGRLAEADAMAHPKRNEINNALGFDNRIEIQGDYLDAGSSPFLPGDLLMLCSDGLTDLVTNKEMTAVLTQSSSLQQKAQALIDAANNAGGKDNITVVLVKHDKKPQKQRATKPVLVKKEAAKVDKASVAPVSQAPTPAAPVQKKRGGSNVALWVFVPLTLLLAGLSYWLWNGKKNAEALLPKPAAPAVPSPDAQRLRDSLGLAVRTFNFSDTVNRKPITLNDTLFVRQDSLRINGNGLVLQADSAYGGPALLVTANNKFLLLENISFIGFATAVALQGKGVQLKNVRFNNGKTAVQRVVSIPEGKPLTGVYRDTLILKKDSLPK